jgi:AcrR family transcriptional regulator
MTTRKISVPQTGAAAKTAAPRAAERLLETATDLFYHQGIRAIGVDEIVETAGVTKPSLYRNFTSKDELAASYLRAYDLRFWARFDASVEACPGDPHAQILHFFKGVGERATRINYRGCGLTNAAVEYPERGHPARVVSESNKRVLLDRLVSMANEMGAKDPEMLGEGLLLLLEGAYASAQLFGEGGPARSIARNAELLIDASLRAQN